MPEPESQVVESDEPFPSTSPSSAPLSEDQPPLVNTPAQAASPAEMTNEQKIQMISELAKSKLGATDPMQVKDKVMEATGIAFVTFNLDKIIETLKQL